ncbi:MAG: NfeD family protein [Synergistaceae bacterium]|nr:NfeD family protein [Synergistaceae bacterium]
MSRIFIFQLPFDYTLRLTSTEMFFWGALLLIILVLSIKSLFVKVQGGSEGLVGQNVIALGDFSEKGESYEGQVLCMSEIWTAIADFQVKKGDRFMVSRSEGLTLYLCNNK